MGIRVYQPSDASDLAKLFYAAVHQGAAAHYTAEQLQAWVPELPPTSLIEEWASDGRVFLVAEDESGLVAFGDLEADGHLDHLFCRPDRAGLGITAKLYAALERAANEQAIGFIFVEASEPARRFFLRQGFSVEYRRDFELRAVPIHNYRMTKQLENRTSFRLGSHWPRNLPFRY